MLVYETQKWGGFAVLWRVFCKCDWTGSVFPTVLPWSCVATAIATLIKVDEEFEWRMFSSVHDDSLFDQTYALQIWATAVGFALVFRGNLAYGRFWEGRIQIAKFSSYMQDTALMCVCYDEANKNMNQYREWKQDILHLFSLLHALGLQCLRGDDNLDNLQKFDPWEGYKQSAGQSEPRTGLPKGGGATFGMSAGTATVKGGTNSSTGRTSPTNPPPVGLAMQARRYSVKPNMRIEQMRAALAASSDSEQGNVAIVLESSPLVTAATSRDSNESARHHRRHPGGNGLSVDVGDVNLNLVLEHESKRGGVTHKRRGGHASTSSADAAAAEARSAGGKRLEELSSATPSQQPAAQRNKSPPSRVGSKGQQFLRVVPAEIATDPVLMDRQYDEQFVHPISTARVAAATSTFDRMDRNRSGLLSLGDLHRVLKHDREQHLAACMVANEVDQQTEAPMPSSAADDGDDAAAAAAAAAAMTAAAKPKKMRKPKKMAKTGEGDAVGSAVSRSVSTDSQNLSTKNQSEKNLSDREVRKIALRAMQIMRVEVALRTSAQARLLLDWVGSVPFFRDNALGEDAMSAISKKVSIQTYTVGENIVTQGDVGDAFYAILSGDVDVFVDGRSVGQMTVPSSFGDRALEGDDERKATIRATNEVTVARLSREAYHACIDRVFEAAEATVHSPRGHENTALGESIRMADYAAALITLTLPIEQRSDLQNRNLEDWVGTVDYFKMNARTEQHRIEIAKALQPVYVNDEEIVFRQGDIGDAFYCIMQGEVDILVDGKSVGTLSAGACFGDRALEASLVEGGEPDKRAATIRAIGDITLARLSADAYHACIDRVIMAASATPRSATRAETDLEVLAKAAAEHPLSVISGLSNEERIALDSCETFNGNRVIIVQSWITQAIVRRRNAGGLDVDPPVLATGVFRNFQCANDAYFQCKKIVDTPFPYPYAQSMLLMLCLYTLIAPVMICQIVNSTPWAVTTSFITVSIFVALNEVARGLEEPFGSGDDSNKIAVDALHMDFNENLWCLTQKVYQR